MDIPLCHILELSIIPIPLVRIHYGAWGTHVRAQCTSLMQGLALDTKRAMTRQLVLVSLLRRNLGQ